MKQKNVKILELLIVTMRIYRRNMWGSYKDICKNKLKLKVMYDSKQDAAIFTGTVRQPI